MSKLVLLRHGESLWNKANRFTGWVDVPLSKNGIEEAKSAGKKMGKIMFDQIFVSNLVRAQMTAFIAMSEHPQKATPVLLHESGEKPKEWYAYHGSPDMVPVKVAWELNERMYGDLQGLDKDETRAKFGKEQVHIWRRSFDVAPPGGESLELTAKRTIPYFTEVVMPLINEGKNILISAHGNSLRSIVMHLDNLNQDEVLKLEIPTGDPICYEFKDGSGTRKPL